MVTAIVLINAERHSINKVLQQLVEIEGVKEVYSVAGIYDIVAIVRAKKHDELAEVVTEKMLALEGINRTNTLIAFKTYSRYDLERMWSVGFE